MEQCVGGNYLQAINILGHFSVPVQSHPKSEVAILTHPPTSKEANFLFMKSPLGSN